MVSVVELTKEQKQKLPWVSEDEPIYRFEPTITEQQMAQMIHTDLLLCNTIFYEFIDDNHVKLVKPYEHWDGTDFPTEQERFRVLLEEMLKHYLEPKAPEPPKEPRKIKAKIKNRVKVQVTEKK